MIKINVDGSVVSVQETEPLYSGSQDVHICSFSFDKSWEKYIKSAEFRSNGMVIPSVIGEDDTCVLPWELLVRDTIGCSVEVGVYGVSADSEVLTSVRDRIGTVREGTELGSDIREPSAGVYEQLAASIKKVDSKLVSYSEEVQTLTQRAESAAALAAADSESAAESRQAATGAAATAVNAKTAVEAALNNLPEGDTLIINDLTTGGTSAALSAEMGKTLEQSKVPAVSVYYNDPMSADDLIVPMALIKLSATSNAELLEIFGAGHSFAYVRTYFYSKATTVNSRIQFAYSYRGSPAKMAMRLYNQIDKVWTPWQDMAREKPTGSYTGNGGSMSIATGGDGVAVLVNCSTKGLSALVVFAGAISFNAGTIIGHSWTAAQYVNNMLILNTADSALNESGVEYTYQVL